MKLIKGLNNIIKKPILLLTVTSIVFAFGIVRCAGEIDAQAQTIVEISK